MLLPAQIAKCLRITGFAIGIAVAVPVAGYAQSSAPSYAKSFVGLCTVALAGDGTHAERLAKAGFKGKRIKLARGVFVFAPKAEGDLCRLAFGNVFPNPQAMMNLLKAELAARGFKDTGKTIATEKASNPFAGTGATTRGIFTNGQTFITLETAGNGRTTTPTFALQRYSN